MARVSVIMPAHNCERHVGEAISSVLNQSLHDMELIIINDGSSDRTIEIVKSFKDNRIKLLSQRHQGMAVALNRGLSACSAEHVARMDADDIALPDRLSRQLHFMEENPERVLVGCLYQYMTPRGKRVPSHWGTNKDKWFEESWETIVKSRRHHGDPTVMFRRSVARAVGGYRNYSKRAQDVDFIVRLLEKGLGASLNEVLYLYRLNLVPFDDEACSGALVRELAIQRKLKNSVENSESRPCFCSRRKSSQEIKNEIFAVNWRRTCHCIDARDFISALKFALGAWTQGSLTKENMILTLRLLVTALLR